MLSCVYRTVISFTRFSAVTGLTVCSLYATDVYVKIKIKYVKVCLLKFVKQYTLITIFTI